MPNKKIKKTTEAQKEQADRFKIIAQAYRDFMSSEHSDIILEDLLLSSGILRFRPSEDNRDVWKSEGVKEFLFNSLLSKCSITEEMLQQMIMQRMKNKY